MQVAPSYRSRKVLPRYFYNSGIDKKEYQGLLARDNIKSIYQKCANNPSLIRTRVYTNGRQTLGNAIIENKLVNNNNNDTTPNPLGWATQQTTLCFTLSSGREPPLPTMHTSPCRV